jgi:F-type H+-transporting ATPase subunit b
MSRLPHPYRKTGFLFLMSLTVFLFCCASVFASGAEEAGPAKGVLWDLAARVLNFTLLVIVLFVAVRKAGLKSFFTARTEEIRQRLTEMKNGQAEAEEKCRLLEERIQAFESQSQKIAEQYRSEGLAEKERIIAEARQKAQQILDQAQRAAQQEIRTAAERIKAELGLRAVQKTEDLIRKELTDQDQDRLVNEFMERIKKVQ